VSTTDPAAPAELQETPDAHGAFPRLSDEQIAELEPHGQRRRTRVGDVLFRQGEPTTDFIVILSGRVAITDRVGEHERRIGVHGPRRFVGELNLLTGQASFVTGVVAEAGEVLVVDVNRLREVVTQDQALGDLIMRAFLLRRWILIGLGTGMKIVGSRYSHDTRRLRDLAARNRVPHQWIDLEDDPEAEALLRELCVAPDETPIVILDGERVLRNPSNADVARAIGLKPADPPEGVCDLIVVGAGPAGLAASVYGASEGLRTLTLDGVATGGQAATSSRIENYLGFPAGISGGDLADRAVVQARRFGADFSVPAQAAALQERHGHHVVVLEDGGEVVGRALIVATGVQYRRLPVPRLEELEETSVFYAATLMEAKLCVGETVAVVGGGNSAGQATLFLARHTARVHLIAREAELDQNMSRYLVDRILSEPGVEAHLHTEVRELVGDRTLEALVVEDNLTGERRTLPAQKLFVFIGAQPHTDWLAGQLRLDSGGYVLTGAAAAPTRARAGADRHAPGLLETSRAGIYAAGDVRSGSVGRVAAAVGEGSMAVRLVHAYLDRHHPAAAPPQASRVSS
jgi:thioredoxin reductase (NADPH)